MGHKKAGIFGGGIVGGRVRFFVFFKKNGPFPAPFSLFSSFQHTVDSIQMFDINKKNIADDCIRTADL